MNVLVLNCGSSSVKFQLIATDLEAIDQNRDQRLARGAVERIGGEAIINLRREGGEQVKSTAPLRDVKSAVSFVLNWLTSSDSGVAVNNISEIHAVGHRVVHGGEQFTQSVLISDEVMRGIEDCIELAPLHNPANIKGIQA